MKAKSLKKTKNKQQRPQPHLSSSSRPHPLPSGCQPVDLDLPKARKPRRHAEGHPYRHTGRPRDQVDKRHFDAAPDRRVQGWGCCRVPPRLYRARLRPWRRCRVGEEQTQTKRTKNEPAKTKERRRDAFDHNHATQTKVCTNETGYISQLYKHTQLQHTT